MPRTAADDQIGPDTLATKLVEHLELPLDSVVAGTVSATAPVDDAERVRIEWTQVAYVDRDTFRKLLSSAARVQGYAGPDGTVWR